MAGAMQTATMTLTAFQRRWGDLFYQVAVLKTATILTWRGKPAVAAVPVDEYEALLEAREQLAWMREVRGETDAAAE